jgi:TolB-like protein/Tfp pilus assembly protein PilF
MGLRESNGSLGRADAMISRLRRATTEWTARLHKGYSESIRQQKRVASPPSSDYGTTDESISSKGKREEPRHAPHIPDLKLIRCIGQGSYGEVWLARNILGTYRAVKIVERKAFQDEEAFEREFSGLQQFEPVSREHDGFVAILHVGRNRAEGFFYYVMELADNDSNSDRIEPENYVPKTLSNELGRCGRLSVEQAAQLGLSLSQALAELHQRGLVHRDVKPSNIIFVKSHAKLADIGLVAQVGEKARLGTEGYIPPEGPGKPQADLYSLGMVLYEATTGTDRLDYPALPPDFDTMAQREAFLKLNSIILKACDTDLRKRYQTATEISDDLTRLGFGTAMPRVRSSVLRKPVAAFSTVVIGTLAVALAFYWFRSPTTTLTPEKSIAVLPFENLSDNKQNSYFADGVQDEILTDLAKIADLKVIGRTSVMQYKNETARNLREIGRQLGVAHLVEGSVQRVGNRVRVNAQLLDARNDRHLWGETYDRDLSDVFAIQSEIAKAIAEQLQTKLSPAEQAAIERAPTSDVNAFDMYTRANGLLLGAAFGSNERANLLEAADLLNQAAAKDPSFFEAYCLLSYIHDLLYFLGLDHTAARLALAETAIQAASRLRPDAGETHLARAQNLYYGYLDYDAALAELQVAEQTLPNDPRVFELTGYIQRRQGHWEASTRNLERAIELDPRNIDILEQSTLNYVVLRRHADEKSAWDRMVAIVPNNPEIEASRAQAEWSWTADTRRLHQAVDSIRAMNPGAIPTIAHSWLICALAERDVAGAKEALAAADDNPINLGGEVYLNRLFMEGVIARMTNDGDKARSAFTAARAEQEKIVQAQPNFGPAFCVLGLIDAALGRKEEALREGRRAVELVPMEKDAMRSRSIVRYLAMIAAWVGDKDLACEQLAIAARPPSTLSYGQLELLPFWDPLRGDPCFEKIVASLAPK